MNRFWMMSVCLFPLLFGAGSVSADAETEALFERANQLYEEGHFLDAIQAYQPLLTNHPTTALCFNLGNAYFKSGQLGEAIFHYRMAERETPRDPDVRANLRFARGHVGGPSLQPEWFQRRIRALTPREWVLLTSGVIWAFFVLMIARQWRPSLLSWTWLSGAMAAITLALAFWAARSHAERRVAVVTQRDAVMRLGPFEESQSALDLKNGAELRVLDSKQGWIQVTPDDRQLGWVTLTSVRVVEP